MKRFVRSLTAAILTGTTLFAHAETDWSSLESDVNLIIANDLGRNGAHLQRPVAELMGNVAELADAEAVLALGDVHHYLGVESVSDPLWMTNFETVYSHPELQISWLPVLGNHEYRGDTQAVLDYSQVSRRWEMPARYYSHIFENEGTRVKVVFIDTAPLIDKYRNSASEYRDAAAQDMETQLRWLDRELADREGAEWLIVAGHHPVYAYTDKSESERTDMQRRVAPLLRKHKADMYVCGHIHNFQHIREEASDIDYIVNSSGSLSRKKTGHIESIEMTGGEPSDASAHTEFCDGREGFSLLTADRNVLNLYMIDSNGKVIHTVSRKR